MSKPRTNVLMVHALDPAVFGGGEKLELGLISRTFDPKEFSWFAVVKPGGSFSAHLQNLGVQTFDLPISGVVGADQGLVNTLRFVFNNLVACIPLIRLIERQRIDIVYSITRGALIPSTIAGLLTGVPLVSHFHDFPRNHAFYGFFAFFGSKFIVLSSEVLKTRLTSIPLIGASLRRRTRIIPNGVDVHSFVERRDPETVKSKLQTQGCYPVIAVVGRVEEAKGQDVLINAAPEIVQAFPDTAFVLIGGFEERGSFYRSLKTRISHLQLEKNVVFTGFRTDVQDLLSASDILVSASRNEVLSIAILEGMASGKPVIATDVGGTREQVVDGETGYLIPSADEKKLAEKVIELAKNPEHIMRMGTAGKKRVEEQFSFDTYVQKMIDLFKECVSK